MGFLFLSTRWLRWLCIIGAVLFTIHFVAEACIAWLTPTWHSAAHLLGFIPAFMFATVLIALKDPLRAGPGRWGWGLSVIGLFLFAGGNFYYAVFHGWLSLENAQSIADIMLFLGYFLLDTGGILLALALLQFQAIPRMVAGLFLGGSLILFPGWWLIDYVWKLYTMSGLFKYFIALLIVLPYALAWYWLGICLSSLNKPAISRAAGT